MARTCIFCGGRANTREHAFPKWLVRLQPNAGIQGRRGSQSLDWPSIKVRQVCHECNNGWMSDLEGAVRSILIPMLQGEDVRLDMRQQLILAAWITKTAMVFECSTDVADTDRFYSDSDRRHLVKQETPPPAVWGIWIARYALETALFAKGSYLSDVELVAHKGRLCKGYVFNFGIGHFVAQILGVRDELDETIPFVVDVRPSAKAYIQIRFPIPAVNWPPSVSLDDLGNSLEAFTERFSKQGSPP